MRIDFMPRIYLLSVSLLVVWLSGCNPPQRPSFDEISRPDPAKPQTLATEPDESAAKGIEGMALKSMNVPWETWHSYYMAGKPIGYIHVQCGYDTEGNRDNVRTTVADKLTLRRGNAMFIQSLVQNSIEDRSGTLISFDADLRVGPVRSQFEGQASGEVLSTARIRGTDRQTERAPWQPTAGGLAAIQQSLLAKPMVIGETRRFQLLLPIQYRLGSVELVCRTRASISVLDGAVPNALEIDVKTSMGDGPLIDSTIWIDEKGNLLKTYVPALDLSAIRSTKALAEATIDSAGAATPDLLSVLSVDVKGKLTTPAETFRSAFKIIPKPRVGKAEPPTVTFPPQINQWFRAKDDGSIQLLVSRDPNEPSRDGFTTLTSEPVDEDSKPNAIIDSNAGEVKKLAGLTRATEPRIIATDLARTVSQLIGPGDFSRGFATASQTARDSVGDCTERAVLLAAMLRAREIPSRVVTGLVYTESGGSPKMQYHMWTLAWSGEAWISLDPTSGGLAPADRIALASGNLADGDEYKFLSSILDTIGSIDVEIINAKYQPVE